jgi:hypothetical protein
MDDDLTDLDAGALLACGVGGGAGPSTSPLETHAGYRARQCGQGRYGWLTPHGLGVLVDTEDVAASPASTPG